MNRCSVGGVGPGLRPVSGPVLSAGCVRAGEDWPDFNGVLVSSGLSAGNYGGEKAIRQCWAAQRGGRAHAQQGGESCHGRDQSSVKQSADPGPWFSGKRLGHWFRAPQLSRISRDTILKTERGNTARRQHQCMRARTQTHSHTDSLSFFFSLSLTHKTHQQLGRGLQPLPYYHSNGISHIWAQMKTLWAATGIFILPVNGSILIVSLCACRTLPPDWVNELQLEVLGASDKHLVILQITGYLHCKCNFIYLCGKGASISAVKTFEFWLIFITSLHPLWNVVQTNGSHMREAARSCKVIAVCSN